MQLEGCPQHEGQAACHMPMINVPQNAEEKTPLFLNPGRQTNGPLIINHIPNLMIVQVTIPSAVTATQSAEQRQRQTQRQDAVTQTTEPLISKPLCRVLIPMLCAVVFVGSIWLARTK
jgi:hypothetical protein